MPKYNARQFNDKIAFFTAQRIQEAEKFRRNPAPLPRNLPPELIEEVIGFLQANIPLDQVADHFNLSQQVIQQIKDTMPRTRAYFDEKKRMVERLLRTTQKSYNQISAETTVGVNTIRRWVSAYSWPARTQQYSQEFKEEVTAWCDAHPRASYTEIAKTFEISAATAKRWCGNIGHRKKAKRATAEQKAQAIELAKTTQLSYSEIGKQVGVAGQTVMTWCLKAGARERKLRTFPNEYKARIRALCVKYNFDYRTVAGLTGADVKNIRSWCRQLKKEHSGNKLQRRRRN